MKFPKFGWKKRATLLSAVALLMLTSCALSPDDRARKFQEEQFANLILRYSTDETIFRLKPEASEGGFLRIYNRDQIRAEASHADGHRNLAVVVLDYIHSPDRERRIIQGWVASLGEANYRRVVFLRARDHGRINGLRIVDDVLIPQAAFLPRAMDVEFVALPD